MSKICQNCGRPMADDMRFCEACGAPAPVAAPQQPAYQQPAYQQAPQQPAYQQPAYQQPQQPAYQQPAYQQPQQPAYQQPVYQQAPQQPAYQQPAYQQAPQGYRPAPVAAPAKPEKKSNFDINKIFDQIKTFANGVVNRCKTDKKFLITCCAIAGAVLIAIILAVVLLSGGGYKAPIDTFIAVNVKGKANQIKNMAPAAYWEWYEEEYDEDVNDLIDDFKDEWDDVKDELEDEYGKNVRVTYKIEKTKDLSDKKVEKIAEALDEQYDIDEKSVKAAKELDVEMTIKGSEDDEDNDMEITVVKIGSKWYWINYYESGDEYRVYFNIG